MTRAVRRTRWLALGAGCAAALLVIAITSGAGPGLDPDALGYLGAASSLAHHGSLRVPASTWDAADSTSALTTWPPGFSVAIAIPERFGVSQLSSARIVLAASAFVSGAVLFLLLDEAAGAVAAMGGVIAVFVTPAIVEVHLSVLSEPLFLALLLLTLWLMVRRPPRPFLAGIPAAAATMVRYAGLCAPLAVVLWFFFAGRKSLRQRFTDAAKAGLVPVMVFGAWVIRDSRISNAQSSPDLAIYGNWAATLREAAHTIADWLAPGIESPSFQAIVAIGAAVAIAFVVMRAWRRIEGEPPVDGSASALVLMRADILLLTCYVSTLLSARLLVGDAIPFDFRLLAPALLLTEAGIVIAFTIFVRRAIKPVRAVVVVALCVWVAGAITVSSADVMDAVTDGDDFASDDWRASPTLEWVRTKSAGLTLFTNWTSAIYFYTHRVSRDIPESLDTADLRKFGEILKQRHGAFVAFTEYNTDYPPSDSIAHALGLVQAEKFSDGTIWVSPVTEPK